MYDESFLHEISRSRIKLAGHHQVVHHMATCWSIHFGPPTRKNPNHPRRDPYKSNICAGLSSMYRLTQRVRWETTSKLVLTSTIYGWGTESSCNTTWSDWSTRCSLTNLIGWLLCDVLGIASFAGLFSSAEVEQKYLSIEKFFRPMTESPGCVYVWT